MVKRGVMMTSLYSMAAREIVKSSIEQLLKIGQFKEVLQAQGDEGFRDFQDRLIEIEKLNCKIREWGKAIEDHYE